MREILTIQDEPIGTKFVTKALDNLSDKPDIDFNGCQMTDNFSQLDSPSTQYREGFVKQFVPRVVIIDWESCIANSIQAGGCGRKVDSNNMVSGDPEVWNSRPKGSHACNAEKLVDQSIEFIRKKLSRADLMEGIQIRLSMNGEQREGTALLSKNKTTSKSWNRICSNLSTLHFFKVCKRDLTRFKSNFIDIKNAQDDRPDFVLYKGHDWTACGIGFHSSCEQRGNTYCLSLTCTINSLPASILSKNSFKSKGFACTRNMLIYPQLEIRISIESSLISAPMYLNNAQSFVSHPNELITCFRQIAFLLRKLVEQYTIEKAPSIRNSIARIHTRPIGQSLIVSSWIVLDGNNANSLKDEVVSEEDDKEEQMQLLLSLLRRSEQELAEGFVKELWSMRELILFQGLPSLSAGRSCSTVAQIPVEKSDAVHVLGRECSRSSLTTYRTTATLPVQKIDTTTQTTQIGHRCKHGRRLRRPLRVNSDPLPIWTDRYNRTESRVLYVRLDSSRSSSRWKTAIRPHYFLSDRAKAKLATRMTRHYETRKQKASNSNRRICKSHCRVLTHDRPALPLRLPYWEILNSKEGHCVLTDTATIYLSPNLSVPNRHNRLDKCIAEENVHLTSCLKKIPIPPNALTQTVVDSNHPLSTNCVSVRLNSSDIKRTESTDQHVSKEGCVKTMHRSLSDRKGAENAPHHLPERGYVKAMRLRSGDLRAELPVQQRWSVLGYMPVLSHSSGSVSDKMSRSASIEPIVSLNRRRRAILWKFSRINKGEDLRKNNVATWYANQPNEDPDGMHDITDAMFKNDFDGTSVGSSQSASRMQKIPDDESDTEFPVEEFYREAGISITGCERPLIRKLFRNVQDDEGAISRISNDILSSSATSNPTSPLSRIDEKSDLSWRLNQIQKNLKVSGSIINGESQPVTLVDPANEGRLRGKIADLLSFQFVKKAISGVDLTTPSSSVKQPTLLTAPDITMGISNGPKRKSVKRRSKISSKQKQFSEKWTIAKMSNLSRPSRVHKAGVSNGVMGQSETEAGNTGVFLRFLYNAQQGSVQHSKNARRSSKGFIAQTERNLPASDAQVNDQGATHKARIEPLTTKPRHGLNVFRGSRRHSANITSTFIDVSHKSLPLHTSSRSSIHGNPKAINTISDKPNIKSTDENMESRRSLKLKADSNRASIRLSHSNLPLATGKQSTDRSSVTSAGMLPVRNIQTLVASAGTSPLPAIPSTGRSVAGISNQTTKLDHNVMTIPTSSKETSTPVKADRPTTEIPVRDRSFMDKSFMDRPSQIKTIQTRLMNKKPVKQVSTSTAIESTSKSTTTVTTINTGLTNISDNQIRRKSIPNLPQNQIISEPGLSDRSRESKRAVENATSGKSSSREKTSADLIKGEIAKALKNVTPPAAVRKSATNHEKRFKTKSLAEQGSTTREVSSTKVTPPSTPPPPSPPPPPPPSSSSMQQVQLTPPNVTNLNVQDLFQRSLGLFRTSQAVESELADNEHIVPVKTKGNEMRPHSEAETPANERLFQKEIQSFRSVSKRSDQETLKTSTSLIFGQKEHQEPSDIRINRYLEKHDEPIHNIQPTSYIHTQPSMKQRSMSDSFLHKSSQQSGDFGQAPKSHATSSLLSVRTTGTVVTTLSNGSSEAEFRDGFFTETEFILPPY